MERVKWHDTKMDEKTKKAAEATFLTDQDKDNHFHRQMKIIYHTFFKPQSRYMAEYSSGVCRPSICRYVDMLKKRGLIKVHPMGICEISGRRVEFLTTNPKHIKKST